MHIEQMTIMELEEHFNSLLENETYTSKEPRNVRNFMCNTISATLQEHNNFYVGTTTSTGFTLDICGIGISFSVSMKNPGDIKSIGKIKFKSASKLLLFSPRWELHRVKKGFWKRDDWKLTAEHNFVDVCEESRIRFYKKDQIRFMDMRSAWIIDSKIDKNKLLMEIVKHMMKPMAANLFGNIKKDKQFKASKKKLPAVLIEKMPKSCEFKEGWDLLTQAVNEVYANEIYDVYFNIYK